MSSSIESTVKTLGVHATCLSSSEQVPGMTCIFSRLLLRLKGTIQGSGCCRRYDLNGPFSKPTVAFTDTQMRCSEQFYGAMYVYTCRLGYLFPKTIILRSDCYTYFTYILFIRSDTSYIVKYICGSSDKQM